MSVLEYTGLGLLVLALISGVVLMPKVYLGVRYILWGWAAQLISAPLQVISVDNSFAALITHAMPTYFPLLLLMGTLEFVGRRAPSWLLLAGSCVALARGLCAYTGYFDLGRVISIPFELAAYGYAAWILWGGKLPKELAHGILSLCMLAICGVEIWDALINNQSRGGPVSAMPWLVVLVATSSAQIYAWLDKHRKEVEANSRSAKDRFDALTNHTRDVIAEIDDSGILTYVSPNSYRALGLKSEDLVGMSIADLAESVKAENQNEAVQFSDPSSLQAIVANGPYEHLYKTRNPAGASRYVEIAASHYFNAEGQIRAVAVVREITERIESTQTALASQKLESLGTMSAGIAHDFRNLLTAIRGSAELLQLDLDSANKDIIDNHFKQIFAATDQASGLTDQLLTYAGKTPVELRPLDISAVMSDLKPLLVSAIADRASLDVRVAPGLPKISANPVAIQQMLINLVTNAVEAINDNHGHIRIEADFDGSVANHPQVLLRVIDNGMGMDEETQAHVFEPFYSTKFAGRGLGLAALQGLVKAHNGEIKVVSFPNEGATFTIGLPAVIDSV